MGRMELSIIPLSNGKSTGRKREEEERENENRRRENEGDTQLQGISSQN